MKTLEFTVKVSFTHYIDSELEIKQVANNIANALMEKVMEDTLAPETEDVMTTNIRVVSVHSPNIIVNRHIMDDIS